MTRAALLFLLLSAGAPAQQAPAPAQTAPAQTVGMIGTIEDLVLPGSELETVPFDVKSPIVLRITAARPHGTAHRYDLEFVGLEPGHYDLRQYLRRKDGTPATDLPAMPVEVTAVRAAAQVQPNALLPQPAPRLGGYRTLLWVAGGAWVVGLLLILFAFRRKRAAASAVTRPPTLAERLRPIVDDALAGRLPDERRAELERLLLGFWRHRLGLQAEPAAQAIPRLRQHEEAGALLRQLELWLHAPPGARNDVDVAALLRPYEHLPADEEHVA